MPELMMRTFDTPTHICGSQTEQQFEFTTYHFVFQMEIHSNLSITRLQINHIPNCGYFTNKLGLLLSLRAYEYKVKSYNKLGLWYTMKNFVPDTYWIDDASERAEFNAVQKGQLYVML